MAKEINWSRVRFFQSQVHHPAWKKTMAGENEMRVINILRQLGYMEGADFVRQYPIGERFVIDFAFVKEQIALEVDGTGHDEKTQKVLDRKRDSYLRTIDWVPMRVREDWFNGPKGSFWKYLIQEVVEDRREMWQRGRLYPIEFPNYEEQDFE